MKTLFKFLSTGFYSGLIPKAPGTIGSFVALLLIICLKFYFFSPWNIIFILITVLVFVIGVYLSQFSVDVIFNREDPKEVVIDEFVGMFIACLSIEGRNTSFKEISSYVVAFAFFRLFDILKPYPINKLDEIDGGVGIMLDDVLAGIFTLIIVIVYRYIFNYL